MVDHQFIGYTLLQTTAITAITSTRIYHGLRPQSSSISSLPCINFFQMSGGGKDNGIKSATFSINCRAVDPAAARSLSGAVADVFGGSFGTGVYGESSSFSVARSSVVRDGGLLPEIESGCFNAPVDVMIVYTT